jgi:hypothetical protein
MTLADARSLLSFNATTAQPTTFRQHGLIRRSRSLHLSHDDRVLPGELVHGVLPPKSEHSNRYLIQFANAGLLAVRLSS